MDDKLKGAFLRNVKAATGGMGNPGAFDGPLPEYFQGKSDVANNNALMKMATGFGFGGLGLVAPEALPITLPAAALSFTGAMGDTVEGHDMRSASDMWKNTGLPQRPKR
jgi:hypothetical protein